MSGKLVLHEYAASGNCYKVRLTAALLGLELDSEQCRGQPHFVAIAGRRIFVKHQRLAHRPTSSTIFPTCSPDSIRACASAASASG